MNTRSSQDIRSLFVLDTEPPWIRSLLHAMPSSVRIHGFRIRNCFLFPGGIREQIQKVGRSEIVSESWDDTWVSIPSWHRAYNISSWLVHRQIIKAIRRFGQPDAILFNLPWYAAVAHKLLGVTKAYYAYDPYRFYDWNTGIINTLEKQILTDCHVGFGVSKLLVEDLQAMTTRPVYYLPNATHWRIDDTVAEGETLAEMDLQSVSKPSLGCVGQINYNAYDWDLIEHLSVNLPHVNLIFIGPRYRQESEAAESRVDSILGLSNVHWLGPKPHEQLPAYLKKFDILINPLLVNPHNNRRSLLRLYDYLATDRPIVSSAISEAFVHLKFVQIAKNKEDFCRIVSEILTTNVTLELDGRINYILANSWQVRATELLKRVGTYDST